MAKDEINVNEGGGMVSPTPKLKNHLQRDVHLKIFVIGVGNAGNQVVVKAHKAGMDVFAINSSVKDLSDQIVDETIPCFIIGKEARGAGKNIEKGIELFKSNGRELFSIPHFMDKVQESDIVFVVGATGGGTGASACPEICSVLTRMFPKKIIIFYGITPKDNDSATATKNNLLTLDKIKNLNIPYLLSDLSFYEDEANDVAFNKIDDHVVESIRALSGEYLNISNSQMIDENDMKTLCGEPGYMGVYMLNNVTSKQLENESMQAMIIKQIKNSPTMSIQKDGILRHMGIIINCPTDLMEVTKTGNYSEMTQYVGGRPSGSFFENYAVNNGTSGQFIVILSGMTFPQNRIAQYIESVKRDLENSQRVKEIDLSSEIDQITLMSHSADIDKLSSNTSADQKQINAALDEFFG